MSTPIIIAGGYSAFCNVNLDAMCDKTNHMELHFMLLEGFQTPQFPPKPLKTASQITLFHYWITTHIQKCKKNELFETIDKVYHYMLLERF